MKNLLPALFLLLFVLSSCKKEKSPAVSVTTSSPPTISGISPATGTPGTVVTITGTNFKNSTTVSFNGAAGIVQSNTATEITVIVPPSSSGNVSVTTNNQTVIGPVFTYTVPTITAISPSTGTSNTLVTITGTNFGTSLTGIIVSFHGINGVTQSVTNTEIKVVVPVTTTGKITLIQGTQIVTGPVFTYNTILDSPYKSGDVTLKSQAEVDSFVSQNKGRQLQITGTLIVSGADISSLSGLSNITSVSGNIFLDGCPLLADVSFLSGITSTGSLFIQNLAVTTIAMDKPTGVAGSVTVSNCKYLNSLSMKSLSSLTTNIVVGNINIYSCKQLSRIDFSSLTSITGLLSINGTAVSDMSGFSSLQTAGALTLSGNPFLLNFHGLEQLKTLTLRGISWVVYPSSSVIYGLYINGNPLLSSLTGLQNLTSVPVARISNNVALSDLCPLKALAIKLSALPVLSLSVIGYKPGPSTDALILTGNSNYPATADALDAIKLCN